MCECVWLFWGFLMNRCWEPQQTCWLLCYCWTASKTHCSWDMEDSLTSAYQTLLEKCYLTSFIIYECLNKHFFSHSKHSVYVLDFQYKCITVNMHKTQNYFLWYSTAMWYTTDVIHRCLVINNQHMTLTIKSSVHRNKLYTVPSFCKLSKYWLTLLYIMWLVIPQYCWICDSGWHMFQGLLINFE